MCKIFYINYLIVCVLYDRRYWRTFVAFRGVFLSCQYRHRDSGHIFQQEASRHHEIMIHDGLEVTFYQQDLLSLLHYPRTAE